MPRTVGNGDSSSSSSYSKRIILIRILIFTFHTLFIFLVRILLSSHHRLDGFIYHLSSFKAECIPIFLILIFRFRS